MNFNSKVTQLAVISALLSTTNGVVAVFNSKYLPGKKCGTATPMTGPQYIRIQQTFTLLDCQEQVKTEGKVFFSHEGNTSRCVTCDDTDVSTLKDEDAETDIGTLWQEGAGAALFDYTGVTADSTFKRAEGYRCFGGQVLVGETVDTCATAIAANPTPATQFNFNATDKTCEMCTDILSDVALAQDMEGWTIYEIAPGAAELTALAAAKVIADAAADLAEMTSLGYDAASWTLFKTVKTGKVTCGADLANPAAECVTGVAETGYSCGTTSFLKTETDFVNASSYFEKICQETLKCGENDAAFPAALIPDSVVYAKVDCLFPLNSIKLAASTLFAAAGIAFAM